MFDLVTVLISKQSFFQHHIWPVYQSKSYLHGIALQDFCIVSSLFYKNSKQARVPTFVWLFRDVATTVKGPGCDEGTNLRFRGSSADAPPCSGSGEDVNSHFSSGFLFTPSFSGAEPFVQFW